MLFIIIVYFDIIYIWGRFDPDHRWNTDQVPLPFASKPRRVLDFIGVPQVWVFPPSAGLLKCQCSLMLTICANGKHVCVNVCMCISKVK